MKKAKIENFGQCHLANPLVHLLLEIVDDHLAEEVCAGGCLYCLEGRLHSARYPRKPRPGSQPWEEVSRRSFCCDQEGCRKRHTPPSVRFFGRRFYSSVVVVLMAAAHHGLTPERVRALREALGIDRRTLQRWRQWWLETFVQSSFWKSARARFLPLLCEKSLPLSLMAAFGLDGPHRWGKWLNLLKFLSPLTTSSIPLMRAF